MIKLVKIVGTATILSGFVMSTAVAINGNSGHFDRFSCYASQQVSCYGNGEVNCTEEEYNMGLDWCDQSYPSAEIDTQRDPSNLKATVKRGKKFMLR